MPGSRYSEGGSPNRDYSAGRFPGSGSPGKGSPDRGYPGGRDPDGRYPGHRYPSWVRYVLIGVFLLVLLTPRQPAGPGAGSTETESGNVSSTQQKVTEAEPGTGESPKETANAGQKTAESVQETAEPGLKMTESLPKTAEPGLKMTESLPKTAEPGQKTAGTAESLQKPEETRQSGGLEVTEKHISVPGLDKTYRLVVCADLQMILKDEPWVDSDQKEEVKSRYDMFQTSSGEHAEELWKRLPGILDGMGADMILFAGDMVDFATESSTAALKKGLDSLKTPWMYVRGDHDYGAWYSRDYESQEDAIRLQADAAPREKVMEKTVGKLSVIGWDNNTTLITKKGLASLEEDLKTAREAGNTAVFLCHVPLLGEKTDALKKLSAEKNGEALLWGKDCAYIPAKSTVTAIDDVLAADSPVALVVSGHLHFPWQGPLTDTISQIVAPPAFEGRIEELVLEPVSS